MVEPLDGRMGKIKGLPKHLNLGEHCERSFAPVSIYN